MSVKIKIVRESLLNIIKRYLKKAIVMIKNYFIDLLCRLGIHKYRLLKKYYTYVGLEGSVTKNRRALTKIYSCKHCHHKKMIVDVHNTIL